MSIVKRLSTTLISRIDNLVGDIENHEALIKAAIDEQKKKIAAAKIQLRKIKVSETHTVERLEAEAERTLKWQQRALKEAEHDESKALLCLQRRQKGLEQQAKLREMVAEYRVTRERVAQDVAQCEGALKSLMQKHELMRARQSSVDAMSAINETGGADFDHLQASFDRWEIRLAQGEMGDRELDSIDLLEQEYRADENDQVLRLQLAELIQGQQSLSE
ncbi:phage shock protein A (PspA) family protein [Sinobacterium caligoides]|uniref:Phage shock protein A (PspA) family protein n=1 Tax=Sinobacterium caligoides TaxID=933926 RepID=A0A3N2DKQ5_9GAMM|nr:PspA/IM30 family protein [Sinobacterium caligoides]ROS00358.1 phage shock protein A (PspA) family protein [Sinobacterium caligoides]